MSLFMCHLWRRRYLFDCIYNVNPKTSFLRSRKFNGIYLGMVHEYFDAVPFQHSRRLFKVRWLTKFREIIDDVLEIVSLHGHTSAADLRWQPSTSCVDTRRESFAPRLTHKDSCPSVLSRVAKNARLSRSDDQRSRYIWRTIVALVTVSSSYPWCTSTIIARQKWNLVLWLFQSHAPMHLFLHQQGEWAPSSRWRRCPMMLASHVKMNVHWRVSPTFPKVFIQESSVVKRWWICWTMPKRTVRPRNSTK